MRKEKHMVSILVRGLSEGFASAVLARHCPAHLYQRASLHCMTQMSHICTGGRNVRQRNTRCCKPFISKARPVVDLVRQLIRVLSSILAGWFVPALPCAQPRAPPAYHYQASGPYCITDGADRRERRQPACFLERRGVYS